MIKCVTFDITNTLMRVNGSVGAQYSRILKHKFGYNLDADLTNKSFGRLFKEQNKINPGYGFSKGMSSYDWWTNIVRELLALNAKAQNQKSLSQAQIDQMSDHIFKEFVSTECWSTYNHVDYLLGGLKDKNIKLGVISNFDERLFKIMDNLKLSSYFDFVLIPANSNGEYKPSKEIFERACRLFKVSQSSSVLHVGDSLELDYLAARKAGLSAILMLHGHHEPGKWSDEVKAIDTQNCLATDLKNLLTKIFEKT